MQNVHAPGKIELEAGLEALAAQQRDAQAHDAARQALCEHLKEEVGSLHATAVVLRAGQEEICSEVRKAQEEALATLEQEKRIFAKQLDALAAQEANSRESLERKLQRRLAAADEDVKSAAKVYTADHCQEILKQVDKTTLVLASRIADLGKQMDNQLQGAVGSIGKELHTLRVADAVAERNTEALARELALSTQAQCTALGKRAESMARTIVSNTQ